MYQRMIDFRPIDTKTHQYFSPAMTSFHHIGQIVSFTGNLPPLTGTAREYENDFTGHIIRGVIVSMGYFMTHARLSK